MKCGRCQKVVAVADVRCPHCGAWGSVRRWHRARQIERREVARLRTGLDAVDTLVGGGWVPGTVYRLSGPPGSGKSTLALDVASRVPALYATAEEAASSIGARLDRIAARRGDELLVGEVTCVEDLRRDPPPVALVVVDSLHRLRSPQVSGAAGSNAQLVHAAEQLVALAREVQVVVLVVAHVNKDGDSAGTVGVDHDVDALLELEPAAVEGAPSTLRVRKNRHGPAPVRLAVQLTSEGLNYGEEQATG